MSLRRSLVMLGTFCCLLLWNFWRLNKGDRYWYSTYSANVVGTSKTLNAKSMSWTTTPEVHNAQHQVEEEKGLGLLGVDECDELMSSLNQNGTTATATTVNRLRRHLMIHHRDCFQHHRDFFEDFFIRRTSSIKQHWILHVPKTAGTSLCRLVEKSPQFTSEGDNCWVDPYFCPLWCCCNSRSPLTSCNDLTSLPDVVMNENYWDHLSPAGNITDENDNDENCASHRIASIMLRNPVDRAMSHANHFQRIKFPLPWRLKLIQSNYLTWSLVAGLYSNTKNIRIAKVNNTKNNLVNYRFFIPQPQHVEAAKTTLAGMDFLLQFSRDAECDARILRFMGFDKTELGRVRSSHKNITAPEYQEQFNRTEFEAMNQLDTEVYQYAMQIMEVDCGFFASMDTNLKQ